MKIILAILAVVVIVVLALGFLFVQWANLPENVAALQKKRQDEAAQKIEDEKKEAQALQEIEAKKANLKLAIDESFANNRFESLDFNYPKFSMFTFEKNSFNCSELVTHGQNPGNFFFLSKEDYGDFAAEMSFGIWGADAYTGIVWDVKQNDDKDPTEYQGAYSSPETLFVKTSGVKNFGLGGIIASENEQLLRVERFGDHLSVSINGRTLFNQMVKPTDKGKIGIYIGNHGGIRESPQSISIGIKSFKVWN